MKECILCLKGTGQLQTDNQSFRVEYVINEYEDRIPAGTHQNPSATIAGLHSLDGHIRSAAHPYGLPLSDAPYTLQLKDGTKLKVHVTRTEGSLNDVRGIGGLF